jgi:hypothetical protein
LVQVELGMEFGTVLGMSLDSELDTVPGAPLRSKIGSELGETLGSKLGIELGMDLGTKLGALLGSRLGTEHEKCWTYTRCAARIQNRIKTKQKLVGWCCGCDYLASYILKEVSINMMCIATDAKTIDLRKWAGVALIGRFATVQNRIGLEGPYAIFLSPRRLASTAADESGRLT